MCRGHLSTRTIADGTPTLGIDARHRDRASRPGLRRRAGKPLHQSFALFLAPKPGTRSVLIRTPGRPAFDVRLGMFYGAVSSPSTALNPAVPPRKMHHTSITKLGKIDDHTNLPFATNDVSDDTSICKRTLILDVRAIFRPIHRAGVAIQRADTARSSSPPTMHARPHEPLHPSI